MSRLAAFAELGKPRLSALAVLAVLAGVFLGAASLPTAWLLLSTGTGTALVAAGGNALNMFLERDSDRFMQRTEGRPLPAGRLGSGEVLGFGLFTASVGVALLWWATNPLAAALCAAIFVSYVLVYTPMKRRSTLNTLVGAVPGALPPVVGYAASSGRVDERALVLFLILFLWQIPHFLAIAWGYREQYRAAGMQMLPVVDTGGRSTAVQMVLYCATLVLVSTMPSLPWVGLTGSLYTFAALALGAMFLIATVAAAIVRQPAAMRRCFLVSIVYLPLLFGVMVVDKILKTPTV
ncbi:MAG: heme o synthase [Planctomycetes bacterium]|nr:heme o synthase [Planctomycetota bacterium]MCB9869015.1 protoheme IX farnesyltransferase [Planctomycetota bacterium]MCB9887975.1 protoheme IX farnesyltransferase [Planctomycetota bacterium]